MLITSMSNILRAPNAISQYIKILVIYGNIVISDIFGNILEISRIINSFFSHKTFVVQSYQLRYKKVKSVIQSQYSYKISNLKWKKTGVHFSFMEYSSKGS